MPEANDPEPEDRVVLHTSYPKTGSTLLPSLVERLGEACSGYQLGKFTFAKSKNNLRARTDAGVTLHLLKTHHTVEDFFSRASGERESEVPALRSFMEEGVAGLAESGRGLVYSIRNPFATLASAIQFSKLVYDRAGEPDKWRQDGRATRYFVDLLGLKAVPHVDVFLKFDFLALPTAWVEDICWRYVDNRGSIPFLEPVGALSYFEHVNHHQTHLARAHDSCLLTYEDLMAGDAASLADIGRVTGVPPTDLRLSLDAEAQDREGRTGRYTIPFFDSFQVATPQRISQLPTWRQIRSRTLALCPPLAVTLSRDA